MPEPLDILAVAAHPDDAEISVGGVLAQCGDAGLRAGIVDLTDGEPTPHGTPQIRAAETHAASEVLAIAWRKNLGLPNRNLRDTVEARRALAGVFRTTRPRVVLAPYWEDAHPDHVHASALADAARFWAKLSRSDLPGEPYYPPRVFYYWSIHLRQHPRPTLVVDVSDAMTRKMQAVECYRSQFAHHEAAASPTPLDDIRDRARYWGWSIGARYAEPLASREEFRVSGARALCGA